MSNVASNIVFKHKQLAAVELRQGAENGELLILPILRISDLSENLRAQIDTGLDGTLNILTAGPGAASATIDLVDSLPSCDGNATRKLESAIAAYKDKFRGNPTISISVSPNGNTGTKITINGVVVSFTVNATMPQNGSAVVGVTLKIVGELK